MESFKPLVSRREAIAAVGMGVAALAAPGLLAEPPKGVTPTKPADAPAPVLVLPELGFPDDALEPVIDAMTMNIHRTRHHAAFITNGNRLLEGLALAKLAPEQMVTKLADAPEDRRTPLRNNLGGHLNHVHFWKSLAPKGQTSFGVGGGEPAGALADAIKAGFGDFATFKTRYTEAAMGRFGSGWAWLALRDGKLAIGSTANQDSPLMPESMVAFSGVPILGLDVWEHAYYLKYQNRRKDYVDAWWNVVNWPRAAELFAAATGR